MKTKKLFSLDPTVAARLSEEGNQSEVVNRLLAEHYQLNTAPPEVMATEQELEPLINAPGPTILDEPEVASDAHLDALEESLAEPTEGPLVGGSHLPQEPAEAPETTTIPIKVSGEQVDTAEVKAGPVEEPVTEVEVPVNVGGQPVCEKCGAPKLSPICINCL